LENRLESKLEEIPRATFFTQEINEVTRKVSNACDLLRIDLATGLSSASNALLGENSIGRISTGLAEETISVSNISAIYALLFVKLKTRHSTPLFLQ
jgi:hypothetical protein